MLRSSKPRWTKGQSHSIGLCRSSHLLLLGQGQRPGVLEHCVTRRADRAVLTEDGETDRAHEADVDEIFVAKTGCTIVHALGARETQTLPQTLIGEEDPDQELQ